MMSIRLGVCLWFRDGLQAVRRRKGGPYTDEIYVSVVTIHCERRLSIESACRCLRRAARAVSGINFLIIHVARLANQSLFTFTIHK